MDYNPLMAHHHKTLLISFVICALLASGNIMDFEALLWLLSDIIWMTKVCYSRCPSKKSCSFPDDVLSYFLPFIDGHIINNQLIIRIYNIIWLRVWNQMSQCLSHLKHLLQYHLNEILNNRHNQTIWYK